MSDTEQIYSLYVQANPVPDPGRLPATVNEAELLMAERSRTMDTQQRPKVQDTTRRTGWRTAAIAFAAVILVVGAVVGIAALARDGDDDVVAVAAEEPTLTFDGTTATYSGPETLQGDEPFILTNTSEDDIYFAWGLISDDSITVEDELAWIAANPDSKTTPPWLIAWGEIGRVDPGETVERTASLIKGRNDLAAFPPITRDPLADMEYRNRASYVAAIIEVTGD